MKTFKALLIALVLTAAAAAQQQPHGGSLSISSTQPANITGNSYYQSTTSGGPYTKIAACTNIATNLPCTVSGLAASTTYYFVATAICSTCQAPTESGFSPQVSGTTKPDQPPSPQPPVLNPPTQMSENPPVVQETWALSTLPDVTRQFVFRQAQTQWVQQKQLMPTVTSYQDTRVQKGKTYGYKVTAVNKAGTTLASTPVSITVQ